MALILAYHSSIMGAVAIPISRITQLIAFLIFVSWLVGTNANRQLECYGDECLDGIRSIQSSSSEQRVHAKLALSHSTEVRRIQTRIEGHRPDPRSAAYVNGLDPRLEARRPQCIRGREPLRRRRQLLGSSRIANSTSSSRREVGALISFKMGISADPLGSLGSWRETDSTPCKWRGVSCSWSSSSNALLGENHVVSVDLTGLQLKGNTDVALRALGKLRFLERLDLSNNMFTGSMSGRGFANWTSLLTLNMSQNSIVGSLPPEIGQLINLKELDFYANNLTGEIPPSVFNCTALRLLDLGTNFLSGSFPEQVGRLSNLEILILGNDLDSLKSYNPDVYGNSFTGSVPASLGNCTSLKILKLQTNSYLGGEILPVLTQLKSLEIVRISQCSFVGSIPVEIGNLTNLQSLSLAFNNFQGQVPVEIGNLRSIQGLFLNTNNFSGVIPTSILNCTEMITLSFEQNEQLAGELPSEIGRLSNLEYITFWSNSLTGVIPASMSNCSALQYIAISDIPTMDPQPFPLWLSSLPDLQLIYISNINLYGTIPKELGRLSNLKELSIYSNNLTGGLPSELGNCSQLTLAQLGGNQLTGPIPPEIGHLSNLDAFSIGYGNMSGPLPATLWNLTQLTTFDISHNFFTGTIGDHWEGLTQLQAILFQNNNFVGSIPALPASLSQLQEVHFASNNLTGVIPQSVGSLASLEQLDLSNNRLHGIIPAELSKASSLSVLDLSWNNLEGSIPFSIAELSGLQHLSLSSNMLGGPVPDSLQNCMGLLTLDLSHNRFEGNVPGDVFTAMGALTTLNLSSNRFSGAWPPQMSSLANLQNLNISGNNLSGLFNISSGGSGTAAASDNTGSSSSGGGSGWNSLTSLDISYNKSLGGLPAALGSLPALEFFNASYNDFEGPNPTFTTRTGVELNASSFLGNPHLCGDVLGPGRQCRGHVSSKSRHGFRCQHVWIPTLCGAVVLMAGMAIGLTKLWTKTARRDRETTRVRDLSVKLFSDRDLSSKDVLRIIHDGGDNVIGMGSKSVVYKGSFMDDEVFAVKVLSETVYSRGGREDVKSKENKEVLKEVQVMAKLRHRNILKFVGYCSEKGTQALILEYMPGGSLDKHLHASGDGSCRLSWRTRLKVALGIAEGMKYLHHDFPEPLIHGDLKPSNVLLDSTHVPKVADFGLSKFVSAHREGQATASRICGTIGYIPPEYALGTVVSTAGDVYSFGILLLELLTGRSPASDSQVEFDPSIDLRGWVLENFSHNPVNLLDPTLGVENMTETSTSEETRLALLVALLCTRELPQNRPTMKDVLSMLIQISEMRSAPTEKKSLEELANADHEASTNLWSVEHPSGTSSPAVSRASRR